MNAHGPVKPLKDLALSLVPLGVSLLALFGLILLEFDAQSILGWVAVVVVFGMTVGIFVWLAVGVYDGAPFLRLVVAVAGFMALKILVEPPNGFLAKAWHILIAAGFNGVAIALFLSWHTRELQRRRRLRYMERKLQEKGIYMHGPDESIERTFEEVFGHGRAQERNGGGKKEHGAFA